jgi:putative DNA primase/helicase
MEHWTKPVFRTDLEFKTCYYIENLRHADPGWDVYFASVIAADPGIQHCIKHADDAAYYAGPAHIDEWEPPAALAGLSDLRRWVAWRNEPNNPGKPPAKVPYYGIRKRAASDDPKTWRTLAEAEVVAHAIAGEFDSGGGVGIELGDGACLIGIDLDSCRDPEEGDLEPWASEVIERFGSYTEVSPSKTGVKVFALVAPSDLPAMQALLGGKAGRAFKRSGAAHPPGIEVHIDRRYFTVTGWRLGNAELHTVPVDDFRWLIEEAGPRVAGKAEDKGRDESRSAAAFRLGAALRRKGKTFEEMVAALRADPETAEWVEEKGERDGQRELHRIWEKTDPHALDDFALTEDGVALAFAAKFADQLRYCHHKGAWYEWVDTHWRLDETKLAFSWARHVCRQLAQERQKAGAMSTARQAAAVEKFAQSDRAFAVTSENWDRDNWLLGTPGGVVDLRTGQLREADRSDFITKLTAAAPAAVADCPLWLKFLREATDGDNDLIRFLQQWLGYCLTGDTREHALLFIYGSGGNGKGVFLNTVSKILGDYRCVAPMETFTASKNDRHPTELAMLRGARMVCATETEEGRAWAEVRIKQMTGGDAITARFLNREFFTYIPQFKLTLIGNHKPILRNVDDAARRRFNLAAFLHKPPVVDKQLEAKLTAEWAPILRWMIDGCLDWHANGLIRPKAVIDATSKYFGEQDTLRQWVEECCHVGPNFADTNANLFTSWTNYAKIHGEEVGSQKRFNPAMRARIALTENCVPSDPSVPTPG